MLRYGDSDAFSSMNIFLIHVKGVNQTDDFLQFDLSRALQSGRSDLFICNYMIV